MKSQFQPWQLLLLILAGWINRRQQDAIEQYPNLIIAMLYPQKSPQSG